MLKQSYMAPGHNKFNILQHVHLLSSVFGSSFWSVSFYNFLLVCKITKPASLTFDIEPIKPENKVIGKKGANQYKKMLLMFRNIINLLFFIFFFFSPFTCDFPNFFNCL